MPIQQINLTAYATITSSVLLKTETSYIFHYH